MSVDLQYILYTGESATVWAVIWWLVWVISWWG